MADIPSSPPQGQGLANEPLKADNHLETSFTLRLLFQPYFGSGAIASAEIFNHSFWKCLPVS